MGGNKNRNSNKKIDDSNSISKLNAWSPGSLNLDILRRSMGSVTMLLKKVELFVERQPSQEFFHGCIIKLSR